MINNLKSYIKEQIAHTDWFCAEIQAAKVQAIRDAAFEPYEKQLDIKGINAKFLFATPQAREWYDPIKPYAKLEYEWVVNHVPLREQKVIDVGAHHGQYSIVFALAASRECDLVSVDPYPMNCLLTEANLLLNGIKAQIVQCAVADKDGQVFFEKQSNGRIITDGGMLVNSRTIHSLLPNADVVKLDVEGAEYIILPDALETLRSVHTWIIEIHPIGNPHPNELIDLLLAKDYNVLYVNRQKNVVEPYDFDTEWNVHSTIFAQKK